MTPTEWDEIVDWIDQRWPNSWRPEQALAYLEDVSEFDASDVWGGVYAYYGKGVAFPPNGSQLVAAAREERRQAAVADRYDQPALPEPVEKVVESYLNKWYPNDKVTWTEHVRRNHRKRHQDCTNRFCDVHQQHPVPI